MCMCIYLRTCVMVYLDFYLIYQHHNLATKQKILALHLQDNKCLRDDSYIYIYIKQIFYKLNVYKKKIKLYTHTGNMNILYTHASDWVGLSKICSHSTCLIVLQINRYSQQTYCCYSQVLPISSYLIISCCLPLNSLAN